MKPNIYIGIDSDVTASGVCVWNSELQTIMSLETRSFWSLYSLLYECSQRESADVLVVIDAGWLNRSNFHARAYENQRVNAQIGERTGANHEVGKKIAEMCEYLGLPYQLHKPTNGKVKAGYFKFLTGYTKRTNQEERDAAMLVFGR